MSNTTSNPLIARTEFAAAVNQIASERGIEPDVILESIKAAILAAFRKDNPSFFEEIEEADEYIQIELDPGTGAAKVINTETGKDLTPPGFGRIAAQTAKQVILQRVREAEKDAVITEYQDRIDTVINAMVLRFDGKNVILDIGRGQGFMPPEEQITNEFYKMNQRLAVYIREIRDTLRGKTIIVSRSAPELVVKLFAREVPEVGSGAVEIVAVAREAGHRTKIAVKSTQDGVDPVGSCVGQKGVRVQEVINELNGEKIDIIQHSDNTRDFVGAALAPAENLKIEIDEENLIAKVFVPEDQVSLAIGRGGQNVRLAAKLTGYKIDVVGESGEEVASVGSDEPSVDDLAISRSTKAALNRAGISSLAELTEKLETEPEVLGLDEDALAELTSAMGLAVKAE